MNSVASIPLAGDLSELIGPVAERVENRSLLLDKFVFHKSWPVVEADGNRGRDFVKWDEASRWSFMRIADGASEILNREAKLKRDKAGGNNVEPENRDRYLAESRIAETLANVRWDSKELVEMRARHTRRLIGLFRSAYGERAMITIGQLEGRLAINLADSLIQNAGICLDRLFGLPYIPGSAVKGVCRHAALEELKSAPDARKVELLEALCAVFGTAENDFEKGDLKPYRHLLSHDCGDQRGGISFLPAYPVNEAKIVVDLTNVHYPDYYRSGREADLQSERPMPNPFPAVETGARFAFCLVQTRVDEGRDLLGHARRWLEAALTIKGIGAKTASGYGWFSLKPEALGELFAEEAKEAEAIRRKEEADRAAAEAKAREEERQKNLSPEQQRAEELAALSDEAFSAFAKNLASADEAGQRAFLSILRENKEKRERWKTWKKKKPEIVQTVSEVCAKLNLPPLP
jgi:CRISPR type III-B/RAMP module RAMP protein Cmr6